MAHGNYLKSLRNSRRSTRREFLTETAALAAAGVVAPALIDGGAKAATPKKGGRLRMGITDAAVSDSLDPALSITIMQAVMTHGVLQNNLVEIDHEGNPIPELAESWEASDDASQWVFKLRKGVEFHNGKTLDADDVIYTFNHHLREESKSGAKGILGSIEEVRADGKDTVIFDLSGGSADFPFIASEFHMSIFPAGTETVDQHNKGIGTGPYKLEAYEPGVRAVTSRNPNYWKSGRAHFDEVEVLAISDVNARTNALKTDEVDVINRAERKTVHLLREAPGIEIVQSNGTQHYTMPMRTIQAPFDNNDVRLALKYAIDRQALLDFLLRGTGVLGNDHPISQANRYHAELPQRQYDPDKAKFHLNKAGHSTISLQLHASDAAFEGAADACVLYREHAAKAGIDIEVVRTPSDGYWNDVWMQEPWCTGFWFGRPTEDMMFSTAYAAGAAWNDAYWENERFNQLLVEARAELDTNKRAEMYAEMQLIVRDDGGTVIPVFADFLMAASSKLAHGPVASNTEMDGLRVPERWWFA
nr:ABC transporter substrate-binding protein [Desulfuromonadales bacterium]